MRRKMNEETMAGSRAAPWILHICANQRVKLWLRFSLNSTLLMPTNLPYMELIKLFICICQFCWSIICNKGRKYRQGSRERRKNWGHRVKCLMTWYSLTHVLKRWWWNWNIFYNNDLCIVMSFKIIDKFRWEEKR